jgi:predicted lipid-binding transport protein (Tim44 family)
MDIIFLVALAAFIFYKLNSELGKSDEDEKDRIIKKREDIDKKAHQLISQLAQQQEKIVGSKTTADQATEKDQEDKILTTLNESTKQAFKEILQRSNITADFFVNGARFAFEMVLKAFASGDSPTLKLLLSQRIFDGFSAAIEQRKTEEKTLVTNLISLEKSEIISAQVLENRGLVSVRFTSKQINYIFNKSGEVLEGTKDQIAELTDIWTFEKDLNSSNPNWLVVSTQK